ncbi:16S rRNA (guanine(966)-N(2))-methyltransferase RsmD [Oryzomicrobium sp.]|uniref:16S rRNA (guanine(966)-N(2))-methyltransferase RsmD n=1 Tax=Oryzomicrobium sp. TaxID=1911578 RepID=UPI0025F65801|nr:16S rRNA (guanine(966)-N(2))-methyltransferase RsmD [Oryzomicrobium sp.]MCE1243715.1 16S rRNA (guanine(966)-N(2))-methyltransferase RsmD [Oryzomicrobium sp.]
MGNLRIIGGAHRRRVLKFPDVPGLRPTPDRVRETLFNWLGQDLTGQTCLDLFAGSGALGLEAASRGAARVVMVERSPQVAAALKANAKLLGLGCVEVVVADALQFAASAGVPAGGFDVVFLDPPYRQGFLERLEAHLPRLLRPEGALYAEAEAQLAGLAGWTPVREGRAGQVFYHLLRQAEHDGARAA